MFPLHLEPRDMAERLESRWLLIPARGNHGLWLDFTVFMAARALTLGAAYPRLERAVKS